MAADAPFPDKRRGTDQSLLRAVAVLFAATGIGSRTLRALSPTGPTFDVSHQRQVHDRRSGRGADHVARGGQRTCSPIRRSGSTSTAPEIEVTAKLVDVPEKSRIYDEFEKMVDVHRVYKSRTSRDMRIFRLSAV